MTESEVWRDVVGFEGLYKISNKGKLYSVERKNSRGRKCGGRTLKPSRDKNGYIRVTLCENSKLKNKFIHRLVAEAFVHNPNGYSEINHRDENKKNNCVENLEWCTRKHNMNHGTRTERFARSKSKKVKAVNVETGEVITFNSVKEARNKGYYNISQACRGVYCSGHLYKGHRWSYE